MLSIPQGDTKTSSLSPDREQYLVDLLNRNPQHDRTDAAPMKCKVGKPCNGRCIPQSHKCGAPGGLRLPQGEPSQEGQPPVQEKKKMSAINKARLGVGAAYLGLYAGAVGAEMHRQHQVMNTPEGKEWKQKEKEYQEHLKKDPEARKAYQENVAKVREKHGAQQAQQAHEAFKNNYHTQKGSPDIKQPKPEKPWHEELGVRKNASPDEIKTAYRNLSQQHHPDKNSDPGASKKFQAIHEAYKASKRRDARDRWDSIETAYRAAQESHPRIDRRFWRI